MFGRKGSEHIDTMFGRKGSEHIDTGSLIQLIISVHIPDAASSDVRDRFGR